MTTAICESCLDGGRSGALRGDVLLRPMLTALLPWLVTRRWFTHESGCLEDLVPVTASVAEGDTAVLLHALLDARHSSGTTHRYQLLLGLRRTVPEDLRHAVIGRAVDGRWDGWWLYEATEDPELMARLLADAAVGAGPPTTTFTPTGAVPLPGGLVPRVLGVEQSNTSVVYGDRLILKFFRAPQPGPHPETEALRGLTSVGCPSTARLAGWLHTGGDPATATVLGVLAEFVPSDGTGWELAVRQAVSCLTESCPVPAIGGFTADAHALGETVARLHAALGEAFPRTTLDTHAVLRLTGDMDRRLARAVRRVPEMEPYAGRIGSLYDDYAKVALQGRPGTGQRLHGDLHLGQVLSTGDGWKVIDFEGEPAAPVAERGLPQPVLRDVAGMLRSFDYAAHQALDQVLRESEPPSDAARLRLDRRAYAWAIRNRRAFTAGYAAAGGADPNCHPVALRAFEADKAVYEAVYEAEHRPAWLPIPMAAVQRLVFGR
ncbi:hypothetical protein KNE206_79310 [Kitasatospora sp. NE20-6]|uniref:maltokinase N-terminal cap-like domain-containing protein n=1 Tax=Kitasatospora sp. NE20-6 TaxID=2859066 RepID=UPI0034DC4FF2